MAMSGASPIAGGRFDDQLQGAMGQVASLLHLSQAQLGNQLASGSTLSDLASKAGVSNQQLVATIKQGLTDAGSKLSGARLDNLANRISHHHRLHRGGSSQSTSSTSSSSALASAWSSAWSAATSISATSGSSDSSSTFSATA
jgi:hypothetical protein